MAAPIEINKPKLNSARRPPYTVDTLFELPETDQCFEVLEGKLILCPAPTTAHNVAADRIGRLLIPLLPLDAEPITNPAVRLPNGDGPVPDLILTTALPGEHPRGVPAALVHTIFEVVSPSNAATDRVTKTRLYGDAGIPCYWRIEQRRWKEHFGPVPARMASGSRRSRPPVRSATCLSSWTPKAPS